MPSSSVTRSSSGKRTPARARRFQTISAARRALSTARGPETVSCPDAFHPARYDADTL